MRYVTSFRSDTLYKMNAQHHWSNILLSFTVFTTSNQHEWWKRENFSIRNCENALQYCFSAALKMALTIEYLAKVQKLECGHHVQKTAMFYCPLCRHNHIKEHIDKVATLHSFPSTMFKSLHPEFSTEACKLAAFAFIDRLLMLDASLNWRQNIINCIIDYCLMNALKCNIIYLMQ